MFHFKECPSEKLFLVMASGSGIFAKRDIPATKVVAFYNGLILDEQQNEERILSCKISSDVNQCAKYRVPAFEKMASFN
jgi:hypothetical protein